MAVAVWSDLISHLPYRQSSILTDNNYHSSATQSKPHLFSSFFQVCKHIQQKACGPTLQLCGYSARGLTWNKYSLDSWNQGVRIYCPTPSWSLLLLRQMQQKGIYTCASAVQFAVYCLTQTHTFISRLNWDARMKIGAAEMQTHALFLKTQFLPALSPAKAFH